jgi:hypothetical protein
VIVVADERRRITFHYFFSVAFRHPPAATVTSGQMSPCRPPPGGRPSPVSSPRLRASPQPGSSSQPDAGRDSPVPGSSRDGTGTAQSAGRSSSSRDGTAHSSLRTNSSSSGLMDHLGPGFQLRETASFLNGLPPEVFGT